MNDRTHSLPPPLQDIVDDFRLAEGREKLELLLEYAERLPTLPPHLADSPHADQVHECMTPVTVFAESRNGRLSFHFQVPEESPTVRGFAAILREGLQDLTPEEVLAIPSNFYLEMGLGHVLTPQRMNGLVAILAHIKRLALGGLERRQA